MPPPPRRVTAADVARICSTVAPAVTCWQLRATRLWLLDAHEPFCEIDLHDRGSVCGLRFSVHCAPAWAGIVAAALARDVDVLVAPTGFIQRHDGAVVYDHDAEAYWAHHRRLTPLLTARFVPPPH